jgi:predicted ATPase
LVVIEPYKGREFYLLEMLKKIVFAGGSCCGKTTLIKELEKKGFDVIREFAREVLEERKDYPLNAKEILIRQKMMLDRQLKEEERFEKAPPLLNLVFLDRSLIDILAYCKWGLGYVPDEFELFLKAKRYDKVFFLESLPFKKDDIRIERSEEEARRLHEALRVFYKKLKVEIIGVPVMDVEKRVDFILKRIF